MRLTLKLLGVLLCYWTERSLSASTDATTKFDYVIIGGGTAGLVVARRLSEDPTVTVAVIEAGIHHVNEPLVDTPEMFGQAIGNPQFDWVFYTEPQSGLKNNSILYPRGKMLGGSSGLNFMAWDRASAKEYDAWEQLGATGWNWDSIIPYFRKTETVAPPTSSQLFPNSSEIPEAKFDAYHGQTGPIQVSYNVLYLDITDQYVDTVNGLGIPTNSDAYSGDATGIYNTETSIDRVIDVGKRSYSASTYYNSSEDRPNLTLFLSTQATKINFANSSSSGTLEAVSVDVVAINTTGFSGTLTASKEVILSAGSVQTPHVLELSGIGNKTILESVGIETLIHLPGVGENLMDHTLLAQDWQLLDTVFTYDQLRNNATYLAEQQAQYEANSTGIFASVGYALAFPPARSVVSAHVLSEVTKAAANLINSTGISALTKAQYQIQAGWLVADNIASMEYIMEPTGGLTAVSPDPGVAYVTIYIGLMHPFSRGSIHVKSSDPLAHPAIDPKLLDNAVDQVLQLEGAKFARKISESEPLASYVSGAHEPSANVTTDVEWTDYMETYLGTIYHPMGTAAMLPQEIGGVVDPSTMKVYGTSNLRVIDASVIPLIIGNHPQATVYAIAERAADMIKGVI